MNKYLEKIAAEKSKNSKTAKTIGTLVGSVGTAMTAHKAFSKLIPKSPTIKAGVAALTGWSVGQALGGIASKHANRGDK